MSADVPESEYQPADSLVPSTPDGYREPTQFNYPFIALLAGGAVLFPIATLLFGGVLWAIQGPAVFESLVAVTETDSLLTFVFNWPLIVGVTVLALGATVIVHELVHGAVFGWYGYQVSYGAMPQIGAFYAAPFHQFVAREHVFPVALAPIVSISLVGLPLLAVPIPVAAFFIFQLLVINAVGASGDLYIVLVLLRKPAGTLLYDSDIRHSYVFEPR